MTIGERLRNARQSRRLSLQQVADQISLSAATLSRIETSKQNIDLKVFLMLANVLDLNPAELLEKSEDSHDRSLAIKFAAMSSGDRAKVWRELTSASKLQRVQSRRRPQMQTMALEIEELSAQLDLLRQQFEHLLNRLRART